MNLVCGGRRGGFYSPVLSSCEVNKVGEKTWSPMTSLPGVRYGVRGITIGSQVLMMGNIRLVHAVLNMFITIFRRF